jgi:hypothetical protein
MSQNMSVGCLEAAHLHQFRASPGHALRLLHPEKTPAPLFSTTRPALVSKSAELFAC